MPPDKMPRIILNSEKCHRDQNAYKMCKNHDKYTIPCKMTIYIFADVFKYK